MPSKYATIVFQGRSRPLPVAATPPPRQSRATSPTSMGGKTGDGGPPVRGMSRSDKGCAGSGEDGKVTSGQEGLQPVAVRDDNFSG